MCPLTSTFAMSSFDVVIVIAPYVIKELFFYKNV